MNDLMVQNHPLTVSEVVAQVQLIQQVMEKVMKKDVHYGVIPGCKKPSLWKPGAEKLLATFQLVPDSPIIDDLSTDDEIRYRITQRILRMSDNMLVGSASGECSSDEEKYKWRSPVCQAEYDETPEDRKRAVWKKGQSSPYKVTQIRTHPKDVANTILKMAVKRALVAATLEVTAASDIFDQDLEDLPEGMNGQGEQQQKPPVEKPKAKQEPPKEKEQTAPGDKPEPDGPYASEAQSKRFWAMAKGSGKSDDEIHVWLKEKYGITSTTRIPKSMYDMICTNVEK